MRPEQALHQVLQAVGFLDDDLGVLFQGGIGQFVFQQLRRTTDAAKRILDLMGQIADQFAACLLLLDQALLTRCCQMMLNRLQFKQQACAGRQVRTQRRHRAIQVHFLAITTHQFDVLAGVTPIVVQAIIKRRLQRRRTGANVGQRLANDRTTTHRQQVFTGGVDVANKLAVINQQHRRGQKIKAGKGGMGNIHARYCSDSAPDLPYNLPY